MMGTNPALNFQRLITKLGLLSGPNLRRKVRKTVSGLVSQVSRWVIDRQGRRNHGELEGTDDQAGLDIEQANTMEKYKFRKVDSAYL